MKYGHPAHRGFARAVGATDVPMTQPEGPPAIDSPLAADLVSAMVSPLPERDVYILENDSALYLAPRIRGEHPGSKIIHLAAADRLIAERGSALVEETRRRSTTRRLEVLIDRHLLRQFLAYCDGVIAVSELVADRLRPHVTPEMSVRVVNPYIQPAVYGRLRTVAPDLDSTRAVTIGQWRAHKGVEQLVEAWPEVRERQPSAELRIIGSGHPARYAGTPGVSVCGFVDDIETELSNASLYVHPAYIEAFGVSVVEAMCAGLPALVTETTGARVAVENVDDSLLTTASSQSLAATVSRYFATDLRRRSELSRRSREASQSYTEAIQLPRFRNEFQSLVQSLRHERFVHLRKDREP